MAGDADTAMGREAWRWQQPGTTWKGAGLYHITLTVSSRKPMLGRLVMDDDSPATARIERTPFGDALVECLLSIRSRHPEVQVLHFSLMPDHLHAVLYVTRTMPKGIGSVVRGFWQASKKLGRACSATSLGIPNGIRDRYEEGLRQSDDGGLPSFIAPRVNSEELEADRRRLEAFAAGLRRQLGDEAYYRLPPVFTAMPFVRAMARYTQLPATINYLDMNPQRLATKRLRPGYFRVQRGITIGTRSYEGVGNIALLQQERYATVHVRRLLEERANNGDDRPLRDYKNGCVLQARQGTVMVSAFISKQEKEVLRELQRECRQIIVLVDNGFGDYYKPSAGLFDACAAGRLLILSPWAHDSGKRHVTRSDCKALNTIAQELCYSLNATAPQVR